jgi:transketolase
MFAPAQKLTQMTVIVDYNKWQATGRSREVMALDPLADKFRAFGWEAQELDGHDIQALSAAMAAPPGNKPRAIVAHTCKGKGISFMEDDNNWHYRVPNPAEMVRAFEELQLAL